jgi:hypothetical protein
VSNLPGTTRASAEPCPLTQLALAWRERAADLLRWAAAEGAAVAFERAADELETALRRQADELLTLDQGAAASGYSVEHLGRLIRDGKLPNAGRPSAPRIRRGDLPQKRQAVASAAPAQYDPAADARSLLSRRGGVK